MPTLKTNISVLIMLLIVTISVIPKLPTVDISVVNNLGHNGLLDIHCQSRDDDLGYLTLPHGFSTDWTFTVNIWGTTLFYCDVHWENSQWHHFIAYSYHRDSGRCSSNCIWMIGDDGLLYFYDEDRGNWDYIPFQDA